MHRFISFLSVLLLLSFFGIAQEEPAEIIPINSLYESVVVPDRTLLRRLEQADRLFETGRSSEAAQLLGSILEQSDSAFIVPEENTAPPERTLRQTTSDQVIDRLRKLPKEAQNSYAFQFEATAKRLLQDALTAHSEEEIQSIAQKYFSTETGAAASFLVGLTQFERGDYAAAFLTWDKLKRQHPIIPENVKSVLDPLLCDVQNKLQNDPKKTDADAVESAWLEQTGWRLPAGSPSQNSAANASEPLIEQNWTVPLTARLQEERETEMLSRTIIEGEDVYIPSSQPIVAGDLFITRTHQEIVAVNTNTGKRVWTVREPQYRFPNNTSIPAFPAGDPPLRLFFWHDRISHQLSSEGETLFSIEDYDTQKMDILSTGRIPRIRGNIEDPRFLSGNTLTARDLKTGQIRWQVGKFPYVQKSIDFLFAPKQRTASRSAAQPNVDETIFTEDEKVLKETWFLGTPLPLQGRLYVIGETDGLLQLFVLDSQTGRLVNRQAFSQTSSSILANFTRRTYPLFPSASSGIVICPTGCGLVVAMDASTLRPLWCFTYAAAPGTQPVNRMVRNQQRQFPGRNVNDFYMRQLFGDSGWQVPSIMIAGQKVVATPPDQAALYCLDLLSGECLWEHTFTRSDALYAACIQNEKAFLVTPTHLAAFDINSGKDVSFEGHRFNTSQKPTGKGVHSGDQYFIPFTGGYLAVADLNTGTLTWRDTTGSQVSSASLKERAVTKADPMRRLSFAYSFDEFAQNLFSPDLTSDNVFPKPIQFGNLVGIKGRFFSQSPTQISCFDQKEPLKQRTEKLLQTDPNDPAALLQQGRLLKSEGNLTEAIKSFRASFKVSSNIDAADALRRNLLEAIRKDFNTWKSSQQELESLSEFPDEKGIALYAQLEGMLAEQNDQTPTLLAALIERMFALERDSSILIPVGDDHAVQLHRAARSLIEQKLAKNHLPALRAVWNNLAEKYSFHFLPMGERQESLDSPPDWSKISFPYLWKPGKVNVDDVTASYSPSMHINENETEVDRIVNRLAGIVQNSDQSSAGQQLSIPFLGAVDSELSAFDYVVRPGEPEFFLCCNDSSGQERWRLALPMSGWQDFGRLPNTSEGVYVKGFRHFLLFVQGNTMTAINTSPQSETLPQVLWTKKLSSMLLGRHSGSKILASQSQTIGNEVPFPLNSVFVSPQGVFCWDAHCVYAIDPFSGQLLWVRRTTYDHCSLQGDDDNLFLVFPRVQKVLAVDPASGRELARGHLPPGGIHTFGTSIVCVRKREYSNKFALFVTDLRDMYDKRRRALLIADIPEENWAPPIPETLLQDQLHNKSPLQILYGGRFVSLANWHDTKSLQIYDLLEKKTVLPKNNKLLEFVPVGKTEEMRCDVEFVEDKILVLYTKNSSLEKNYSEESMVQGKPYRRTFSAVQGVPYFGIGAGAMMLFDSAGKPCWQEPVVINNWCRLLDVPDRLPVMLFAAAITEEETVKGKVVMMVNGQVFSTDILSTGIMGIDKRSGERRFRNMIAAQPPLQTFRVSVDPLKQEILFKTLELVPTRAIKATFTEENE